MMRPVVACVIATVLLSGCVPRSAPPQPQPTPEPTPPPPEPAPPPSPPPVDWRDAPLSPGDWSYSESGGTSRAVFGNGSAPDFVVRCERDNRVRLVRTGASAARAIVVRTSAGDRSLPATEQDGDAVAALAASDPVLDQIVFSRGRFAVAADGAELLIVPAWPEPARAIENCRT